MVGGYEYCRKSPGVYLIVEITCLPLTAATKKNHVALTNLAVRLRFSFLPKGLTHSLNVKIFIALLISTSPSRQLHMLRPFFTSRTALCSTGHRGLLLTFLLTLALFSRGSFSGNVERRKNIAFEQACYQQRPHKPTVSPITQLAHRSIGSRLHVNFCCCHHGASMRTQKFHVSPVSTSTGVGSGMGGSK